MSDPTTVTVTGKESSSRETAWVDACQRLHREIERRRMVPVGRLGDVHAVTKEARPGRFYVVASVKARER